MIRPTLAMASVAVAVAAHVPAHAQTAAPASAPKAPAATAPAPAQGAVDARADALFQAAKELRDKGQYAEACAKFAQSKELAPGVGISLYLADCYERVGRPASAWHEFRAAEKLAHEHSDKRADVASARAKALEPKLNRLTVQIAPAEGQSGAQLKVDGIPVPPESWNAALAIDPGDHVIVYAAPGQAPTTFTAHIDAAAADATVRVDGPHPGSTETPPAAPSSSPAALVAAAPTATAPPASVTPPASEPTPPPSDSVAVHRNFAYGLTAAGFLGVVVGAGLLAANTPSAPAGTPPDNVRPDPGLTAAAAAAFAVGGVALISAFVAYFTTPHAKDTTKERSSLVVAPAPMPRGGGAFLRTSF